MSASTSTPPLPGQASSSSGSGGRIVLAVILLAVAAAVAWLLTENPIVAAVAGIATGIAFLAFDNLLATAARAARAAASVPATSEPVGQPVGGVAAPQFAEPTAEAAAEVAEKQNARLDPALFDRSSVEIKTNTKGNGKMFSIRVAKHGNSIEECEDAVAVDPRRSVLAVADGASSSFGAGPWADVLTRQFVKTPPKPLSVSSFNSWLQTARGESPSAGGGGGDGDPNGWWSEQGARQGAFSTVVGAAVMADGSDRVATVMCVGDSCAFVLTGQPGARSVRRSLPYEDASQFGSHPSLLGSMSGRPHDEPSWTTIPIGVGDLLVLASDAVSEWLLGDPKRFALLDEDKPEAIATRIVEERTDGQIVNDDMTLAMIEITAGT